MDPVVLISENPTLRLIAATAPPTWERIPWGTPFDERRLCIALCEERGFSSLPKTNCVAVFFDSVRQPELKLQTLGVPVVTLDAPQPGCHFLWTPVDAKLFKPMRYEDRKRIICPIRLKGYPYRQSIVTALAAMGVEVIERDDDKRSYQDYIADLCSAKAVINFCADRKTGKPQMKGRVFETLSAGALLLEEANPITSKLLVKGLDYWEWTNLADLGAVLEFAEKHPSAAKLAALDGQAAARWYNHLFFWQKVKDAGYNLLEWRAPDRAG